ncbi:MAG: DUF4363 family protein [Eubacterium sp.]
MKSFFIAISLAFVIIICSFFSLDHLEKISDNLTEVNNKIISALENDDFATANSSISDLYEYIEQYEPFFAATGNHEEIDNIEMNLAELKAYSAGCLKYDALAKSRSLAFLFGHLPKNSRIKIENIL